ncbi:GDYXXLXY domain-containing protein [Pyruvatibacter sp.]|nr:GDYXXLXY domain-containing protein [Alphaproteobacteria bacterium]
MTDWLESIARAPYRLWGLILAGVLMTALLGQIVIERITLLTSGTEVRLATAPVDPRDIFRGDYVILTYEITRLPLDRLAENKDAFDPGSVVYVTLEEDPSGLWQAKSIDLDRPDASSDTVFIKGKIDWMDTAPLVPTAVPGEDTTLTPRAEEPCINCLNARIAYGIESYFVPEGEGRALEDMRDERSVTVIASVSKNGTAAIKGLILDGGDPVYLEPLL